MGLIVKVRQRQHPQLEIVDYALFHFMFFSLTPLELSFQLLFCTLFRHVLRNRIETFLGLLFISVATTYLVYIHKYNFMGGPITGFRRSVHCKITVLEWSLHRQRLHNTGPKEVDFRGIPGILGRAPNSSPGMLFRRLEHPGEMPPGQLAQLNQSCPDVPCLSRLWAPKRRQSWTSVRRLWCPDALW